MSLDFLFLFPFLGRHLCKLKHYLLFSKEISGTLWGFILRGYIFIMAAATCNYYQH